MALYINITIAAVLITAGIVVALFGSRSMNSRMPTEQQTTRGDGLVIYGLVTVTVLFVIGFSIQQNRISDLERRCLPIGTSILTTRNPVTESEQIASIRTAFTSVGFDTNFTVTGDLYQATSSKSANTISLMVRAGEIVTFGTGN